MEAYVYGERRVLPDGFDLYADPGKSAVVSIDMHQGHLADTPDWYSTKQQMPGK